MVRGLDKFREYFRDFPDSYIIIGGTACDMILGEAGLMARATKDIDIILVIEALSPEFVRQFWTFVKTGDYEKCEEGGEQRKYYRFLKPANGDFPQQVELFSRVPDVLSIDKDVHLTPIPVDDDLSSLSAILMNEVYYTYTLEHSTQTGEVKRANVEALVCLKAHAYLDLSQRKQNGDRIDDKNIRKHKNDVFRLALLLTDNATHDLPVAIKTNMRAFAETVKHDLPDKGFFKDAGAGNIDVAELFKTFLSNFGLRDVL